VVFGKDASTSDRTIPSAWLVSAMKKQDLGEVALTNAIITGPISLKNETVNRSIYLKFCTFAGTEEFTDSSFVRPFIIEDSDFIDNANFWGAQFHSEGRFDRTMFRGGLGMVGAKFDKRADFFKCKCYAQAYFDSCTCEVWSSQMSLWADLMMPKFHCQWIDLRNSAVNGDWSLTDGQVSAGINIDGAHFLQSVRIVSTRIDGNLDLSSVRVDKELTLESDQAESIVLPPGGKLGAAAIRLSGSHYDRINGDVAPLLRGLQVAKAADRETLRYLEHTLRQQGDEEQANLVYSTRLKSERAKAWEDRQVGSWLRYLVYDFLAGYGVDTLRPIELALGAIFIGGLFLACPGAVILRKANVGDPSVVAVLTRSEAWGFSLRLFLPVDIPYGKQWEPASEPVDIGSSKRVWFRVRPDLVATFLLTLPGWVVVPFAVALFSGFFTTS